jgi:hypothetical protein
MEELIVTKIVVFVTGTLSNLRDPMFHIFLQCLFRVHLKQSPNHYY